MDKKIHTDYTRNATTLNSMDRYAFHFYRLDRASLTLLGLYLLSKKVFKR